MREALSSQPDRTESDDEKLAAALKEKLIDLPRDHGAVFDAADATKAGLPVREADPRSDQWRMIWWLWTKYFALRAFVYEGRFASQVTLRFNADA